MANVKEYKLLFQQFFEQIFKLFLQGIWRCFLQFLEEFARGELTTEARRHGEKLRQKRGKSAADFRKMAANTKAFLASNPRTG